METQAALYHIRVKGRLAKNWAEWFDGMTLTYDPDRSETLLQGQVIDQAALYGLLVKIRDLGLLLLSLERIESGEGKRDS